MCVPVRRRAVLGSLGSVCLAGCLGDDAEPERAPTDETGGTLVLGVTQQLDTFDPRLSELAWYASEAHYLFDSLLMTAPDGTEEVPHVATDIEEVSETQYVFPLRDDVTFHDGTPLTAEDVVYSFEWILDPANESPVRSNLEWIETVEATGSHEVTITLSSVFPLARNVLSSTNAPIVPKETAEEMGPAAFGANPVGSGPFEFVSHEPGEYIELEANEEYFLGEPRLDAVRYEIRSREEMLGALSDGTVHEAELTLAELEQAQNTDNVSLTFLSEFDHNGFAFNCLREPFDDVRVREAMQYLVDYDELMGEAVGELGRRTAGYLPMQVNEVWGFPADRWLDTYYPPQDRDRALELLDEAGVGTDFTVELVTIDQAQWRNQSQVFKQALEAVDIETTLVAVSLDEWLSRLDQGEHDIIVYGWTGGTDPDGFYYFLFRDLANDEGGLSEGVVGNASAGYIHEATRGTQLESELQAMDDHIRTARETTETSERYDHYVQAAETIQELYVGMGIYAEERVLGIHDSVQNYEVTSYSVQEAINHWQNAYIETPPR